MQDLGLVMSLAGELLGLSSWAAAPTECESQRCGQTRPGKAVAPAGDCKSLNGFEKDQTRLWYLLGHMRVGSEGGPG